MIAVSVHGRNTDESLALLRSARADADLAEVCLDGMAEFNIETLVRRSPLPLVLTCRCHSEGGAFEGSESERIGILTEAMRAGASYVDVEWSAVRRIARPRTSQTRVIVSRHWFDEMPRSLLPTYQELHGKGDVVKLVGSASSIADLGPVLELMRLADRPVIAIAMGAQGTLSRLVAPVYPRVLLTYGACSEAAATAPGQLPVRKMTRTYFLRKAGPKTRIVVHVCGTRGEAQAAVARNRTSAGAELHLAVLPAAETVKTTCQALKTVAPEWSVEECPCRDRQRPEGSSRPLNGEAIS